MPWIELRYKVQVERLSPSHFPTACPLPAKVERVMTMGRRPGRRASMALREKEDIIEP